MRELVPARGVIPLQGPSVAEHFRELGTGLGFEFFVFHGVRTFLFRSATHRHVPSACIFSTGLRSYTLTT